MKQYCTLQCSLPGTIRQLSRTENDKTSACFVGLTIKNTHTHAHTIKQNKQYIYNIIHGRPLSDPISKLFRHLLNYHIYSYQYFFSSIPSTFSMSVTRILIPPKSISMWHYTNGSMEESYQNGYHSVSFYTPIFAMDWLTHTHTHKLEGNYTCGSTFFVVMTRGVRPTLTCSAE